MQQEICRFALKQYFMQNVFIKKPISFYLNPLENTLFLYFMFTGNCSGKHFPQVK